MAIIKQLKKYAALYIGVIVIYMAARFWYMRSPTAQWRKT